MKEKLWYLYLRFSQQWFTPCKQCQENIEEDFKDGLNKQGLWSIATFAEHVSYYVLCDDCKKDIVKFLENATTIIIGNDQYEPLMEISRK